MPDFIDPWVTVGSIRKAYFYYQIISSKIPAEAEFYSISPRLVCLLLLTMPR